MGMTLVEKILSNHSGRTVRPGEFVLANIDATVSHDANRPLIAAGIDFGCRSFREAAPSIIKRAGISAVIAKGHVRIFFRNRPSLKEE